MSFDGWSPRTHSANSATSYPQSSARMVGPRPPLRTDAKRALKPSTVVVPRPQRDPKAPSSSISAASRSLSAKSLPSPASSSPDYEQRNDGLGLYESPSTKLQRHHSINKSRIATTTRRDSSSRSGYAQDFDDRISEEHEQLLSTDQRSQGFGSTRIHRHAFSPVNAANGVSVPLYEMPEGQMKVPLLRADGNQAPPPSNPSSNGSGAPKITVKKPCWARCRLLSCARHIFCMALFILSGAVCCVAISIEAALFLIVFLSSSGACTFHWPEQLLYKQPRAIAVGTTWHLFYFDPQQPWANCVGKLGLREFMRQKVTSRLLQHEMQEVLLRRSGPHSEATTRLPNVLGVTLTPIFLLLWLGFGLLLGAIVIGAMVIKLLIFDFDSSLLIQKIANQYRQTRQLVQPFIPCIKPSTNTVSNTSGRASNRSSASAYALLKCLYLFVPIVNWLSIAYARWWGAMVAVDTEKRYHLIALHQTTNFMIVSEVLLFLSEIAMFGHLWVTYAEATYAQHLSTRDKIGGLDYSTRMEAAATQLSSLTMWENVHCALVLADAVCVSYFYRAQINGGQGVFGLGFLVPSMACYIFRLAGRNRGKIVRLQQLVAEDLASKALRSMLVSLVLQLLTVAGFASFMLWRMPAMLPSYDTQTAYYNREHRLCDDSWRVNKCKAELFRPPRQHTSDTASFAFLNGDTNRGFINPNKFSGDLPTQYSHACFVGIYAFNLAVVLAYFTAIPFGYFKAVGLGVLPRVKDMGTQLQARHAVVLCLVFCITLIALYSACILFTGYIRVPFEEIQGTDCKSTRFAVANGVHIVVFFTCILCGFAMLQNWGKIFRELTGSLAHQSSKRKRVGERNRVVFGSMRFPVPREAQLLKQELLAFDVELIIVEMNAGGDISQEVFAGIERASTFLVFGTKHYGEDTGNPASSYEEAKYAQNEQKHIILLRMIGWEEEFDHLTARVLFGKNKLEMQWLPGEPMPTTLVRDIVTSIENTVEEKIQPIAVNVAIDAPTDLDYC